MRRYRAGSPQMSTKVEPLSDPAHVARWLQVFVAPRGAPHQRVEKERAVAACEAQLAGTGEGPIRWHESWRGQFPIAVKMRQVGQVARYQVLHRRGLALVFT